MSYDRQHSGHDPARGDAHDLDTRAPGRRSATEGMIQRKAERDANGVMPGAESAVSAASQSTGSALPAQIQRQFESSLGVDLSSVRVHTGSSSVDAASAVGAKAYTLGQDIHFGAGHYDPGSSAGQHLLAHEVAHTVQQRGSAPTRQHKNELAVSAPHDAAEHEADRAADAMVAGLPATAALPIAGVHRKQDPSSGTLQGAGNEAWWNARDEKLSIDTVSVQTDRSRVGELIADIDKHTPVIRQAENQDSDLEAQRAPLAHNTSTRAGLSVFNDKLDVSAVDTTAFAVQYRFVHADYVRLAAEAKEYLAMAGTKSDDPFGAVGKAVGGQDVKLATGNANVERFRTARRNLNTAGQKMDGQLTACRGAANLLQGAIYKAKAAAAAANGKDAATKLAGIRAEIDAVAGGVGKVVKICSGVAGLAGGAGATTALGTPKDSTTPDIDESRSGLRPGQTVNDAQGKEKKDLRHDAGAGPLGGDSQAALIKAMGADVGGLLGGGGGPDKLAETLVKAIGEYANKDKISKLQQDIVKAAAEEATFNAAGDAQSMVGYQDQMEAASKQLQTLLEAYRTSKNEAMEAARVLMEELNKGGKKGKQQATAVLFLSDADQFLAQVDNAISVGKNQQANLKQAATDRKKLRGTTNEAGVDNQNTQYYYRCYKTTVPGRLWGTNDIFKLQKVDVTFQDSGGFGKNDINQGGAGSVEGTGSADDEVARKVKLLETARDQVKAFQKQIQQATGMGEAGVNP